MNKPNILFLLADQLRPDFLGCYGADFLQTPAIDALAADGRRFSNAISPCPLCVPARASMLTGQNAHSCGVIDNLSWLRPDRRDMGIYTWPELLSASGYRTTSIGKMHFYPWDIHEGFDTRIIAEDKRLINIQDDYHHALQSAGYKKMHARHQTGYLAQKGASINDLPDELQVDRWVANRAVEHIHSHNGPEPFALMVGFPGPHCPYDPPVEALKNIAASKITDPRPGTRESRTHLDAFVASYKNEWADLDYTTLSNAEIRTIRHHYAALVERLDNDVGRIVNALRESGQLKNTILIFASDHGDYLGDFEMVGKTYFHEPSIRVPLLITDFRTPCSSINHHPVSLMDLYPSILQWADLPVPPHADGVALDLIQANRALAGVTEHGTMIRNERWKLVRYTNGAEALYDLSNDPDEQHNVIDKSGDIRRNLDIELNRCLLSGMQAANADKRVPQVKSEPSSAFNTRHWVRPYPSAEP